MTATSFDPAWEKTHAEREWGTIPEPRVIEFMERQWPHKAQRRTVRVLDLGTGAGAQAFGLAKLGFVATGVDRSAAAIFRCLKRRKEVDDGYMIEFKCRNVTDLCFYPALFDAVIDCVTLQHLGWDNARKAVREAIYVLKPGGWFLSLAAADDYDLSIPSPSPVRTIAEDKIGDLYEGFRDVTYDRTSHVSRRGHKVSWWQIEAKKSI